MELELGYETAEALTEAVGEMTIADLFSAAEEGGPLTLSGLKGLKTQADVDKVMESLTKERSEHKTTKGEMSPWKALGKTAEEIQTAMDELEEIRLKLENTDDAEGLEEKIKTLAEARIRRELAPKERKISELETGTTEKDAKILELETTIINGKLRTALTDSALKAKVLDTAVGDSVIIGLSEFEVSEDGSIVNKESGLDTDAWFVDQKEKRPHWWPNSVGGGAQGGDAGGGGGGKNPWSVDGWNLTEQGAYLRAHGTEKANKMAKIAGSFIGATASPKKATS